MAYAAAVRPAFSGYYWDVATGILRAHALALPDGTPTAAFEPGYPLFLALVRALVGDHPLAVQVIQALVAAAGAVYLARLTVRLTSDRLSGIVSAYLFAFYPLLIRHATDPTENALFTLTLVGFADAFISMEGPRGAVGAAIWLALAILTRSIAILLIPIAAAIEGRRSWTRAVTLAGTTVLLVAPYGAWLAARTGTMAPSRAGLNLFISNSEYAGDLMPTYAPDLLVDYAERRLAEEAPASATGAALSEEGSESAAFMRLAWHEVLRHPFVTARLKLMNVAYLFSPVLVPYRDLTPDAAFTIDASGRAVGRGGRERPFALQLAYSASYLPIAALAGCGAWLRRRHLFGPDAILWGIVATFVIAYAVFFPTTRYRAPMDVVLLFYAAVAVDGWLGASLLARRSATTPA